MKLYLKKYFLSLVFCGFTHFTFANKLIKIPAGEFVMGCESCELSDATPTHLVKLDSFLIQETPVTHKEFRSFIKATGYKTTAEKDLDSKNFPNVPKEALKAGSASFDGENANPRSELSWWKFEHGIHWNKITKNQKKPSDELYPDHPVIHVSYADAKKYCSWKSLDLPSEAQYEYAARGGLKQKMYVWGDELKPNGKWMANIWQGKFPQHNSQKDGFIHTSPVKAFPKNGYGLYDMAGNVWHWTLDWYSEDTYKKRLNKENNNPINNINHNGRFQNHRVTKGGSFLCSEDYCTRYLVASRGKTEINTTTSHIGFRCVKNF